MNLIMVQDAREKKNKHCNIEKYCNDNNIPIIRKRLNVGDYRLATISDNGRLKFINQVSVDTKGGGLLELANDLYRDKLEFNKKYKKCYQDKIKLIVLVEQPIKTLKDLLEWKSPHTRISGRQLLEMIHTLKVSYQIEFKFCDPKDTGQTVISLLRGEI